MNWIENAIFYHIYPLGFCGAPLRNDFHSQPVSRLNKIVGWLDHIFYEGANAIYLGPLFESTAHGYDTADYYHIDRRLGSDNDLQNLSTEIHRRGLRLVLDGVFNHVGRDFWAFRDVLEKGSTSPFCDWFANLRFGGRSPYGDPFTYEGWSGNYDLVKLNLHNPDVKNHLLGAVETWIRDFDIDGLRLDAADCLDLQFIAELNSFCQQRKSDFWLMGEVVFGDYARWLKPGLLDSVTNYEAYKGLYSSCVDKNMFEIAYALNRQSSEHGLFPNNRLYTFADNHDVDRVASRLSNSKHLYPLYCLLFTMPGIPSIYYGSEWGIKGQRTRSSDHALRPNLDLFQIENNAPQPDLPQVIHRLAELRKSLPALNTGGYRQLLVAAEQLVFLRHLDGENVVVAINISDKAVSVQIPLPAGDAQWVDCLNPGDEFAVCGGQLGIELYPHWARVLQRKP